jgi:ElaB/YqjD/DUF883 family membrane-anchored ribosome-binding protein
MRGSRNSKRRSGTSDTVSDLIDEVATLKADFAEALAQIKSGAVDPAGEKAEKLLAQLGDRASRLYDNVSEQGAVTVEAVRGEVAARPLTALLIAFGMGVVISRMVLR